MSDSVYNWNILPDDVSDIENTNEVFNVCK